MHGLEFNYDLPSHQEIEPLTRYFNALIAHYDRLLLLEGDIPPHQLVTQRVFVNLLKKSRPQRLVYFNSSSNEFPSQLLRLSRDRFKSRHATPPLRSNDMTRVKPVFLFVIFVPFVVYLQSDGVIRCLAGFAHGDVHLARRQVNDHRGQRCIALDLGLGRIGMAADCLGPVKVIAKQAL